MTGIKSLIFCAYEDIILLICGIYGVYLCIKEIKSRTAKKVQPCLNKDMTVPLENGLISIRVGAVIIQNGKFLMVGNERADYLYSVGGRIKFGETAEEAIVREVLEETGVKMEIEQLGFVHENYFYGDSPANLGKLIYEISFFFYMKVPDDFTPACNSFTEDDSKEHLKWVSANETITVYPEFFKKELQHPTNTVKHFVTDERKKQ